MATKKSSSRLGSEPVSLFHDGKKALHPVIYRYSNEIPRVNVMEFFYPRSGDDPKAVRWQQRRDVFLLAFAAMEALPDDDPWSFFQIAGIHGFPFEPYDGVISDWEPIPLKKATTWGSSWWGGYCHHATALFPTWHRPYMLLIEQSVIRQAKLLAEDPRMVGSEERQLVADVADELRFPYWDWGDQSTASQGVPDIFTSTEIKLAYKWKDLASGAAAIPNPLKSFVLPRDVGRTYASSDVYNPAAKPFYVVPPSGTPYLPKGYPTVRHVSSEYTTQNDKLNLAIMRANSADLIPGIHAVFHVTDWWSFSNHSAESTQTEIYGQNFSLETVHDSVHLNLGAGGAIGYNDLAGFDPIFFFHHCNVDRLLALWQYCYPNSWIDDKHETVDGTYTLRPGSVTAADTELTPFRRSQNEGEFLTSNDVRYADLDCGYTYPELKIAREQQWLPQKMLQYMLHKYRPAHNFPANWFVVLSKIPRRAFNVPFYIRVFIDNPTATAATSLNDPHYAGSISIFSRSTIANCPNCDRNQFSRGSVDITPAMVRLGIVTLAEMREPGFTPFTERDGVPLLRADQIKLVVVSACGDFSRELNPADINWVPEPEVYYRTPLLGDAEVDDAMAKVQQPQNRGKPLSLSQSVAKFPLAALVTAPIAVGAGAVAAGAGAVSTVAGGIADFASGLSGIGTRKRPRDPK
eukprot:c29652_g1_i1 orf=408-2474(+)